PCPPPTRSPATIRTPTSASWRRIAAATAAPSRGCARRSAPSASTRCARALTAAEWTRIEAGVKQRVAALNAFLHDIYHARKIILDAVVPADLVFSNPNYRPEMEDFPVRFGTYVHICGIDIVRDQAGEFRVLEDNARTPSGVSYVVENRHVMLRTFPDLIAGIRLRPVDDYGQRL